MLISRFAYLAALVVFAWRMEKYQQKSIPCSIKYSAFLERERGARGERENFFSREKKFSRFPRIISPYHEQSYFFSAGVMVTVTVSFLSDSARNNL